MNLCCAMSLCVSRLARTPGFAAIAILVMALGIGANVALFTIVRSVLLKPLPFKDPDRLLMLYEDSVHDPGQSGLQRGRRWNLPGVEKTEPHIQRPRTRRKRARAACPARAVSCPRSLTVRSFSWDLLPTLGVQPALGRNFIEADDSPSANGTVLLSWGLWKRRFGGNPAILNQSIFIDAAPYTVIGVMPAWFDFPWPGTQLWLPISHEREVKTMTTLSNHTFEVVGRLKPGVSEAQAEADLV